MIGGGPEGGIHKTTNGGKTWTKLTNGLPPGEVGRIALAADPKKPGRVYALIDGKVPAGGRAWRRSRRRRCAAGDAPGDACLQPPAGRPDADGRGQRWLLPQRRHAAQTWTRLTASRCGGPAVLQRDLRRSAHARHDLVGRHQPAVEQGRRPDVDQITASIWARRQRRARRSPRRRLRSVGPEPHHLSATTAASTTPTTAADVALLRQPAGHAVLPRGHRQRGAVLHGVRWHAGQLLALRSVAHHAHARHPQQRLVHRRRRRRLPVAWPIRWIRTSSTRRRRTAACRASIGALAAARAFGRRSRAAAVLAARRGGRRRAWRRCAAGRARRCVAAAGGGARCAIAPTGTRRTSSARTRTRASTGRTQYVYRTDDRGDTWTRISPDLSRNLDWQTLPIMGKVWPRRFDRAPRVDHRAQQRRVDRRIAAARRADLRRHRRWPAAGDRRRRQELAQGRGLPGRAEVDVRERRVRVAA